MLGKTTEEHPGESDRPKGIEPISEVLHRRTHYHGSLRHFPHRADLEMERSETTVNTMFNIQKTSQATSGLSSPSWAFFSLWACTFHLGRGLLVRDTVNVVPGGRRTQVTESMTSSWLLRL